MTFECGGVRYDSDDLLTYRTGDAHHPLVYMTRDHARVFLVEVHKWEGTRVRPVTDRAEIRGLAARFRIDDLLRAIRP